MTTPTPAALQAVNSLGAMELLASHNEAARNLATTIIQSYIDSALAAERARVAEVVKACQGLIEYRRDNTLNFQLEKADDHMERIEAALAAMETTK